MGMAVEILRPEESKDVYAFNEGKIRIGQLDATHMNLWMM
jgi:hypothetical protein